MVGAFQVEVEGVVVGVVAARTPTGLEELGE
jgi:hypothetical protein